MRTLAMFLFRMGVVLGIMTVPTWVLFGPAGAFHHHIGFGRPFFYMVWNGEDPAPGSFQIWEGYEVWFDPLRFAVLLLVWLAVLAGVSLGVRACFRSYSSRPSDGCAASATFAKPEES